MQFTTFATREFILSLLLMFILQTLKVSITQGAHIFSKYMTDQIREDMERDHKVERGIMTREQAEEESERWQQVRSLKICKHCFCERRDGRF